MFCSFELISFPQDFTGVPAVVDLACMRDAMNKLGSDSNKINPLVCFFRTLACAFALYKFIDHNHQRDFKFLTLHQGVIHVL